MSELIDISAIYDNLGGMWIVVVKEDVFGEITAKPVGRLQRINFKELVK